MPGEAGPGRWPAAYVRAAEALRVGSPSASCPTTTDSPSVYGEHRAAWPVSRMAAFSMRDPQTRSPAVRKMTSRAMTAGPSRRTRSRMRRVVVERGSRTAACPRWPSAWRRRPRSVRPAGSAVRASCTREAGVERPAGPVAAATQDRARTAPTPDDRPPPARSPPTASRRLRRSSSRDLRSAARRVRSAGDRSATAPVEHRRREHVVVQLAAGPTPSGLRRGDRAAGSGRARVARAPTPAARPGASVNSRELLRAQRDLPAARRHEEAQRLRMRRRAPRPACRSAHRRRAPGRSCRRRRAAGASRARSSREPARRSPRPRSAASRAADRRSRRAHRRRTPRPARAVVPDRHAPAPDLLEHRIDERGLDLPSRLVPRRGPVEGAPTGSTTAARARRLVEEVEMQVVAVDVRDPALEPLADAARRRPRARR